MNWLIDPIVGTTKKATSWIPIPGVHGRISQDTGSGSESSPLINTRSAPDAESPSQDSQLNFSHEYRTFERSRKALLFCMFHVALYCGIAVGAYGYGFEKWGFVDSIYFAVVIFTTIGYGDLSPSSDSSRLFTVFFALYGIGILGAFLTIIGNAFLDASHNAMAEVETRAKKRVLAMFSTLDESDDDPVNKNLCRKLCVTTLLELPIIATLLILTILLGIPSGRSIISSIYFAIITATTIGFGDFHPSTTAMRAVYIFYLPFSVSVFGQVLSKICGTYMELKTRQADEKFLNRSLALRDLKEMDVDGDGKVSYGEFLSFILVALEKVDQDEVDEIRTLFQSLDVDQSGFLEKADLVKLANADGGSTMQLTDSIKRMAVNEAAAKK